MSETPTEPPAGAKPTDLGAAAPVTEISSTTPPARASDQASPPPQGKAPEIAKATTAASAAGAAAAARAAIEERRGSRSSGNTLFLVALLLIWGIACLAALVTVIYHNTPVSEAAVRQAIAQIPMPSGYVASGPLPADTVIDAYMQPEEDYGILTVGNVRIALKDAERYAWGSYQFNVNPSGNQSVTGMLNNSGPDFEFSSWNQGTTTFVRWNRLTFSFQNGQVWVQGNSYPLNGGTVTVFIDSQGNFVEAIYGR